MMFFMPIFGINQGVQPIIGYNYGARQYDRVREALKIAILVASTIAVFGFVSIFFFTPQIILLFNKDDASLTTMGVNAMRICTMMLPIVGFQVVVASYFQAVGKPRQAMLLSLSRQMLFLIPLILILPEYYGLDGAWAALPASDFLSALLAAVLIAREIRILNSQPVKTVEKDTI